MQLLGLTAAEELEIIDGNVLVRMLYGKAIVRLLLLAGTKIWLRERTIPAELRLGTGHKDTINGTLLDGIVVSWVTLLLSCQWRQITGNRHGANNGKAKTLIAAGNRVCTTCCCDGVISKGKLPNSSWLRL